MRFTGDLCRPPKAEDMMSQLNAGDLCRCGGLFVLDGKTLRDICCNCGAWKDEPN